MNKIHLLDKIRQYENIHIVFWLIKDTCWMLELKWAGTIVMIPTLLLALYIVYRTRHTVEVHINLAILFWILANSYWMMSEFFNHNLYKNLAGIPFAFGFIFVTNYYLKALRGKTAAE
jgi:hypothetical protein